MTDLVKDFENCFEKTETCWEWRRFIAPSGYGYLQRKKRSWRAHRYSYQLYKGALLPNMQIDHLCRNKKCVNPDHLEQVTARENTLRGIGPSAVNAKKTHCAKGHPLIKENLLNLRNGKRLCQICANEKSRKHKAKQKNKLRETQWVRTNDSSKNYVCKRGHSVEGENCYISAKGHRSCYICILTRCGKKEFLGFNKRKTGTYTCKRGHLVDTANTYITPSTGGRRCKKCALSYRERKKAEQSLV